MSLLLAPMLLLTLVSTAQSNNNSVITNNDTIGVGIDSIANTIARDPNSSTIEAKVFYEADDSLVFNLKEKKVYLYNNAEIKYETIELISDKISFDLTNNIVHAEGTKDSLDRDIGEPVFTDKDETFNAHTIDYNFKTKKGKINKIISKQGEGYIHGTDVKKFENNSMYIKDGKYTTCAHKNPHFYIGSTKLRIIPEDKIVSGPALLYIGDVPTPLGVPFGFFPISKGRSSGVLIPAYGNSPSLGFFLEKGGYYLSLSDHFDLALTGSLWTLGSWNANAEMRYKKRYKHDGKFKLSTSTIKLSEEGLPDYSLRRDYNILWQHNQDIKANPYRRFNANVNYQTQSFDRFNAEDITKKLTNTYISSISYIFSNPDKKHTLSTNLRHEQNRQNQTMSFTLPQVTLSRKRFFLFDNIERAAGKKPLPKIGVSYIIDSKNQVTTPGELSRDSLDILLDKNIGIRSVGNVGTSIKLKHITFAPKFKITNRTYFQKAQFDYTGGEIHLDSSVTKTVVPEINNIYNYSISGDFTTNLYGMYQFKRGNVKAIRHVITPTVGFKYQPDFGLDKYGYYTEITDDSLNSANFSYYEDGIYKYPSMGDQGLLTFKIQNNLEMKVKTIKDSVETTKKVKLFERLNFSTNYNALADSMNWSNIETNGSVKLGKFSDITFRSYFDPYITDSLNSPLNTFAWDDRKKIARFTDANISANLRLSAGGPNKKKKTSDKISPEELAYINNNMDLFMDFEVPWSLKLGYQLRLNREFMSKDYFTYIPDTIGLGDAMVIDSIRTKRTIMVDSVMLKPSLQFSGDINITDNWKLSFRSGYDFVDKKLTMTRLTVIRNLHCWEMRFTWVPFGPHQSYTFDINVKSSVLQDLKLSRKRKFTDF
ncbi:MAG: LPS-assembly protein LptD [Flavobacteriales bacterium]|nr:LPS-assembly protein LptD [Flavobacteriales bacterium]